MPLLTAGRAGQVNDLAAQLAADLRSGGAARGTFGAKAAAFEWTIGLPSVIAGGVNTALSQSLAFPAVQVAPSGTPVAKVASKAAKPVAVTITNTSVTLNKYAGMASWSLESQVSTEALAAAVYATLAQGALIAFDADCWAALDAADATATSGATWSAAILNGIADVATRGGAPDVLIMAPGDYAAAVEGAAAGYVLSPTDAVPTLFGLRVVVAAGGVAGKAFVADSAAITCVEHVDSPTVVCDPFTLASTNEIRLIADLLAGVIITSPGSIAEITKAP